MRESQKGEAEAIASQHAEQRVAAQFDREVAEQMLKANADYQTKVRLPLARRGIWPKQTNIASHAMGWKLASCI